MTRVPKAKGRRDNGVAARGRAAWPDIGGGVPFARRGFFRFCGYFGPYKPHVGAFVGEYVSDVFDIAYRDMSDTCGLGVLKPRLERGKLEATCLRLCIEPAAFAFGMQRGVEDADDVEIIVRLFVDDDVGKMRDGEFVRSVRRVATAGQEIQRVVDDAVNAGDHREGRGRVVARDVVCDVLEVLQGLVAESDRHALRTPKREKNSRTLSGAA